MHVYYEIFCWVFVNKRNIKRDYAIGQIAGMEILQQILKSEKSWIFKDQRKINEIEVMIVKLEQYASNWDNSIEQEKYQHRIVDQQWHFLEEP